MKRKDLLGLKDVSADEILAILNCAKDIRGGLHEGRRLDDLKNKTVALLFYENSTRTRVSFETAAKYVSANTVNIAAASSSVQKGETLIDTGRNLESLLVDYIVLRHPMAGAPHLLSKHVSAGVINGGDGANEHPTQALLDMLTVYRRYGSFKGLKVVIAGDCKHSRVMRSNVWGFVKLGASVTIVAPDTLMPAAASRMGCAVSNNLDEAIEGANVVMGLRLQLERQQAGLYPSGDEYNRFYGITKQRLYKADSNVLLLHPGPINRGLEITSEAADGENSLILEQVTNGIAVRMAVLKLLKERR